MVFKKIYLFLLTMVTSLAVNAQGLLPEFSTEADPLWYQVQFQAGNACLADQGVGKNLKTAQKAVQDAQKWQFIGTKESFKMKSKLGNYVNFSGDKFTTATEGVEMNMVTSTKDENFFEIGRKGQSNRMNQWEGSGKDKELGEWGAGDPNNPLQFIPTFVKLPEFSSVDNTKEVWYFLQFRNGMKALTDKGLDVSVRTENPEPTEEQLWKLVGNKDNFQIVNKLGHYAVVSNKIETDTGAGKNDTPIRTSKSAFEGGFSLRESASSDYAPAWEIQPNNRKGECLNQWGGAGVNKTIGIWSANDNNNPIAFVDPTLMKYDDYKSIGITGYTPENDLTLWYNQPATTAPLFNSDNWYSNWMEYSLPIGDGQFGGSLFGGIEKDQILFNEKTLWSGSPTEYGKYEVFGSVFAQYLGDDIYYTTKKAAKNYVRQLDLTTATGKVSFENQQGVVYNREYFASNPARVIAAHYTANQNGKINLLFTLESAKPGITATTTYTAGEATFSGKLKTISYNARLKVLKVGDAGTIETSEKGIEVRNADEVIILLAGGTDYDANSANYISNTAALASNIQARINDASNKTWNELYTEHVTDFQKYFNRVDFQLNGTKNTIPTNELVDSYNKGKGENALMLEKLYFAYGRYLEISSSRGVELPSNLQGIWCNNQSPAWNCDIHANINVQMNYWPAEPTNLSEMHLPFLKYISRMANSAEWKQNAQDSGQKEGWTCYTENNIFGGGGGFMKNYVIANAWYCTHLWQHYRYTLDKKYLKEVFPAMWTASRFWITRLKLAADGTYECPNEYSPEHGPGAQNGVAHAQQLVWDLLDNTAQALQILGAEANVDPKLVEIHMDRLTKLDKGLAMEDYNGEWGEERLKAGNKLLREWKYSPFSESKDPNHRHMSHLMCLYPFSQIEPGSELFQAAINSMLLRGDGATGWSMGWKINLWARALDGDHSRKILSNALAHANHSSGVYYNLFDAHNPFQIDGNFGACSGIAEMIMQSNDGIIRILPALPSAWKDGYMKGLKAVGDFTVDIVWANNKAVSAKIVSNKGSLLQVHYKNIVNADILVNGEYISIMAQEGNNDLATIGASQGDVVTINFDSKSMGSFEINTNEGFGTIFTDKAFTMPTGVEGTTIEAVNAGEGNVGTLVANWNYKAGDKVPANTGLLLKGSKGVYVYNVLNEALATPSNNLLNGSVVNEETTGEAGSKFYKLSYGDVNGKQELGFFWGVDGGAAFMNKAGKAYLAVPGNVQVQGFRLGDLVTGIEGVEAEENGVQAVYNLAGVRMNANNLPKGVYIVNGKKVIIK